MKSRGRRLKFAVEKNIPLPPRSGGKNGGRAMKYPLGEMKVGDSFYAPKSSAKSARAAASSHQRRHKGIEFVSRKEGTGMRIWRTK